jgi:hypothetical protein
MKTNQMMEVKIHEDCIIRISHKTKLGKVDEILTYGNWKREQRGLRPIELNEILRKSEFWEFVIARNTQNYIDELESQSGEFPLRENREECQIGNLPIRDKGTYIESDYSILDEYKDSFGRINYSKLSKQFPKLVKIQRGGKVENRGYWFDLYILLKIASMLDKDLEVAIYDVFIKGKILTNRNDGGIAFKKLNTLIDTLPDRIKKANEKGKPVSKSNKSAYITIAKLVNEKVKGEFLKEWNNSIDDNIIQIKRKEMIDKLCFAIEFGFISSYNQLKATIEKYKFN